MPDGKDKKYVSDPALLSELSNTTQPAGGERQYITDASLLSVLNDEPSNTDYIPATTEIGDVSVKPGSGTARSLQTASVQKPQDVAGKGLQYATEVLNKQYGIKEEKVNDAVFVRKQKSLPDGNVARTTTMYDAGSGDVVEGTAVYNPMHEKERATLALKEETDSPAQVISGDLRNLVGSLPASAKDALTAAGVIDDSFIERVVNRNGDAEALKQYVNYRLPLIEKQKEQEIAAINSHKPIGYTFTEDDERIFQQKKAEIEEKYSDQVDDLQNAAFGLASQKVINQKLQESQGDTRMFDPYEIGMEVQRALGEDVDRQMRSISQGIVDPNERYARGLIGYRALQYAGATAEANGDVATAERIADLTKGYQRKLIDGNPEYRKQQVKEAIANKLYENEQGLGSLITGYTPSKEDVDRVATELGIPAADLEGISPEDIKRQSNLLTSFGQAVSANAAAPLAEGFGRHVMNPIANIFGGGYTQEELDAKYDKDWYYNSDFGRFMGGKQPTAGTLLQGGTKVETNPQSEKYLMSVSDEDNSKWNWNIGSVGNTVIDGAAQILTNATGGKAIGSALMAKGAITNPNVANRIGSLAYIYANGYDRNYKALPDDLPEANKVALANVYSLVEGLAEQILPDYQIADNILKSTGAGRALIDRIAKEGIEGIDKSFMTESLKKAAIEWGENTGKEALEEFATPFGEAMGDIVFAPKQFEERGYLKEAWEQGVVGAISAALPTGAGAVSNIRSRGPMGTSALYEVGKNPVDYINKIKDDATSGAITQDDANKKIQVVNTLSDIVSNTVPETTFGGQELTEKQKAKYASLSLQERLLNEKKASVKDPVQESYIDGQLSELQKEKEVIIASQPNIEQDGQVNEAQETQGQEENVLAAQPLTDQEEVSVPEPPSPVDNMGFEEELVEQPTAQVNEAQVGDGSGAEIISQTNQIDNQVEEFENSELNPAADTDANILPNRPQLSKPIYEMSTKELERFHDELRQFNQDQERAIIGDRYDEYKKARTVSNRMNASWEDIRKANEIMGQIEGALPQELQDKLYGIGEEGVINDEDIKSIVLGVEYVEDQEDVGGLAKAIRNDLIVLSKAPQNIEDYNGAQLESFMRVNAARRRASELGISSLELSSVALKAAASEFSDPDDAAYMLERFMKPISEDAASNTETPRIGQPSELVDQEAEIVQENRAARPVIDYTSKSGNQRVFVENGVLKVVNPKTGKEAPGTTRRRAIAEAANSYDFVSGEYAPEATDTNGWGDEDFGLHIANNSNNPIELVDLYYTQQPEGVGLSSIENAIVDFGGFTTTNSSYNRFGDRNAMSLSKGKSYLNNETGAGLDQIAQEISAHTGVEVSPQDLVDFMDRFPNGVGEATRTYPNKVAEAASQRFEQITGFPLTESISKVALEKEYEAFSQAEKDFINQQYETRQQLEAEFNRAVEEGRFDISSEAGIVQPVAQEEAAAVGERAEPETRAGPEQQPVEETPLTLPEDAPLPPIQQEADEKTLDQQLTDTVNTIKDLTSKIERTQEALEELRKSGFEKTVTFQGKRAVLISLNNKLNDAQAQEERLRNSLDKEYKNLQKKLSKEKQKQTLVSAKIKADEIRKKKKVETSEDVRASILGITDVKVYNAALEIAARAIEAGAHISVAAQQAVDFIKSRNFTQWDEKKFRDDVLGENDLYPLSPEELRKRRANEANLSKKNTEMADALIADVNAGKQSLDEVIMQVQQTTLSQPLKDRITMYIRRATMDHNKTTGNAMADKLIYDNGGDYDAALTQLAMDSELELLNAQTEAEKDSINKKFIVAQTAIQREQLNDKIRNKQIEQAKMFGVARGSETEGELFSLPEQTRAQKADQKLTDKYARLRQAQEASKGITEENDAVAAYRLMRGRAWAKINEIKDYLGDTAKVKGSFFHKLKQAGGDIRGFGKYLYAKHAAERNAKNAEYRQQIFDDKVIDLKNKIGNAVSDEAIAKYQKELDDILQQKNPDYLLMPDGGSGMTNAQADEIIQQVKDDGLFDKYEELAQEFRENVIDKILDYKYDSGLLKDEEYNSIKSSYENYVPLKVDMDEEGNIAVGDDGQTYASKRTSGRDIYKTTGASELAFEMRNNPVLQSIRDLDTSIMKGAENMANQRMANLIRQNPNDTIWEVKSAQYDITRDKNGNVIYGAEKYAPNDGIPVWENGKKSYIVVHDPAMKAMFEKVPATTALRILQNITNVVRFTATLSNPDFILTNPIIDMQDAAAYLGGEKNKEVIKNYKKNLKQYPKVIKQIFSGKGEWADLYKEWAGEGAEVTFTSQVGLDEQAKKTLETFDQYEKPLSLSEMKKVGKILGKVANTLEIATRLVVYKSAKDAGISNEKSALLSRDATIDFEKSGTAGPYINAWKAFANAGIQGSVGTAKLLWRSKRIKQIAGAMVGFGMAQAWLADMMSDCSGDDPEDCYWEVPEWKKQRSVIVPVGDRVLTLPIGRRLGWFNYLGQQAYSVAKGVKTDGDQGESVATASANIVRALLDYYNPTGGDSPFMQQVAGNFGPGVGLMMNENAFGQEISPTNKQDLPDHLNFFPTTPKAYTQAANALSAVTGGGGPEEGGIEISPNTLQHLVQSTTTGLGAFIGRLATLSAKAAGLNDEEVKAKDIPLVNRFYRASEMAKTKERRSELVERAENNTLTENEYERLEGYLDDLIEADQITEDQKDATLKYVDNKQDQLEKRREKFAEAELEDDE